MASGHSCVCNDVTTEPPAHDRLVLATITSVTVAIAHCTLPMPETFLTHSPWWDERDILRGADILDRCAR